VGHDDEQAIEAANAGAGASPGFGSRGRARRRARFLRKARELAYRDLGGLVFNLHRFGQRNDALVLAKLTTLGHIDSELRTLEVALSEREPVTVLREAGITACPRCAAIHSSEDRFCPNCGLSMSRHVDLPVASAASVPGTPAATTPAPQPATPTPQPTQANAPAPPTGPLPGLPVTPPRADPPVVPLPADAHPPVPAQPQSQPAAESSPAPPPAGEPASTGPTGGEEATEIIRPTTGGS
jgi:hypothetical protein